MSASPPTTKGSGSSSPRSARCRPAHPLATLLRQAPDFRQASALADALLHPQDRAYSVPQLFDLLGGAGLQFGRWVWQAHYDAHCGVMARIPQAARLAALPAPERSAAVELFRGTMLRHSVVVYPDDGAGTAPHVTFAGDAWRGYVPIRMPDTICVEEKLPPGAAAVLINPNHAYTDIYLPIDAREKRLYDAIDGTRAIGEIARAQGEQGEMAPMDAARGLFERLYRYDQIAFDASGTASAA